MQLLGSRACLRLRSLDSDGERLRRRLHSKLANFSLPPEILRDMERNKIKLAGLEPRLVSTQLSEPPSENRFEKHLYLDSDSLC